MKGLDTNILLRLITADDRQQTERARRYLERERRHAPFWINRIVLCELIWALSRGLRFDRQQIASTVARLLRAGDVVVEDYRTVQTALYLYRISRADFADCLIGLANGFAGCEKTATFDRAAAELGEFELI